MAHNDWIRPAGVWPLFTILTSNVMHLFDERQMQSINGDLGGTWAPTSTITIGNGLGVTLALKVTGGFQADDAAITTPLGKAIHVFGTLLMDLGSTTTLSGAVGLNNVMTVGGTNGQVLVNFGKQVNVHGEVNILGDGVENVTGALNIMGGGFLNVLSGAIIDCTDGALLTGTLRTSGLFTSLHISALTALFVEGGFTISSGGLGTIATGGRINVASGGELRWQSGGLAKFQDTSELRIEVGATVNNHGTTNRDGPEIRSGNGYTALREVIADPFDTTQTFDPREVDVVAISTSISGGSAYEILADAAIPNGVEITFQRDGNGDLNGVVIVANGSDWFQFHGATQSLSASVTFIKRNGLYKIKSWSGRYGVDGSPLH